MHERAMARRAEQDASATAAAEAAPAAKPAAASKRATVASYEVRLTAS